MPNRLRAILVSVPFITVMVLFVLYVGFGFLGVPALVKWQLEKQVPEQLGQRISLAEVRFNPFKLRLEVGDLALSDPQGNALFGFRRMGVDFSIRSVTARAWVFDELVLDSPLVHFERDKGGQHNFAALLARLGGGEQGGEIPRLVVKRLLLRDGRVEFLDRLLEAPLVTRVAPMLIEVENLSTLPGQSAPYRITARSEAAEKFEVSGALGLNPLSLKGKIALSGVKVVTLTRALSRQLALDAPAGTIDLAADVDLALDMQGRLSGRAGSVDLRVASLSLRAAGAAAPLLAAETLSLKDGRIDLAAHEIAFGAFRIANGSVAASLDAQGRGDWSGLLRAAPATEAAPSAAAAGAPTAAGIKPWRISVAEAEVAQLAVRFTDAANGRHAVIGALGVKMSPSVEAGPAGLRVAITEPRFSLADVTAQQGEGLVALNAVGLDAKSLMASIGPSADASAEGLTLKIVSAGVRQGGQVDLVQLADARIEAGSLELKSAGDADAPELNGEGLTLTLTDAVVREPAGATELARLGNAAFTGGVLRLGQRTLAFDKAALANGKAKGSLDAQGRFNWMHLIGSGAPPAGARTAAATTAPVWRIALKDARLDDFAIDFEDRQRTPAFALGLEAIGVRITGFDSGSAKPVQVDFKAKVKSGGEIEARGQVRVDTPSADIELGLKRIALSPVQPFLSDFAALRLAAGSVSAAGRLRYGAAGKDAGKFAYKGSLAIDGVKLDDTIEKRPFLSWGAISSGDIVATLAPNRVDIGELRVDKPVAKVIIAADRTVNLLDMLKKPDGKAPGDAKPAVPAGGGTGKADGAPGGDPFPVTVARVRVSDGTLEFADLSLRPQFGARMHELNGVIAGLESDLSRSAQVQLDARVDKYGSAKIRGRISARRPQKSTDITMEFRNLEMAALSPYVEKFAGYRIASGRLALDLQYKLRDGKLEGENKIVLNKVELGQKVESPSALDLPLELAIAILKDSEGVIDIGLPVSGDLNDPKFDYGAVIAKALGNMIGGIITAPFRALGALFGGGEKQIDTIAFEPGSDAIAPPERQKLASVARALRERPQLMLNVPPTYATAADTAALGSYTVRADIVRRTGIELRAGEDPGPLDASNPRVQKAVEAAFGELYAPAVFGELKSRAARPPGAAAAPGATSMATPAMPQNANPPRLFYRGLIDRMIRDAPVTEQTLLQLAERRAAAIIRELTSTEGVPAARVVPGEPRKAQETDERAVALQLELGVAK